MVSRLINADVLKESMIGACSIFEKYGIDTMIARAVISIIDVIAGVDAEPVRHGYDKSDDHPFCEFKCSVCDKEIKEFWADYKIDYCPFCGAKMDREDN